MKGAAITALVLAALVVVAPAQAAGADIDRVTVSRSADDVITFRIEFAAPVDLIDVETVQVAIDADRNLDTGIDGLDYSLDWRGSPVLLTAVDGDEVVSEPESLEFRYEGDAASSAIAVSFAVAASDIGSPERFDFYTFVEQDGHRDIAPVHVLFSAAWTYPEDEQAAGDPYPTATYEDLTDLSLSEGGWGFVAILVAVVGGLLALGAIVAVIGWSVDRRRKRRSPPVE